MILKKLDAGDRFLIKEDMEDLGDGETLIAYRVVSMPEVIQDEIPVLHERLGGVEKYSRYTEVIKLM